jgi:hypothetical protein
LDRAKIAAYNFGVWILFGLEMSVSNLSSRNRADTEFNGPDSRAGSKIKGSLHIFFFQRRKMQSTMQRDLAEMVLEVFSSLARFWGIWLEKTCLVGFVLPAVEFVCQHWRCGMVE